MSASPRHAVAADAVFDGAELRHDCAVIIEGARIAALVARNDVPKDVPLRRLAITGNRGK